MFEAERKKASFNKRDLSEIIYGGKEGLEDFLRQQAIVDKDPVLRFDPSFLHQSRHEMMDIMSQKLLRLHEYNNVFKLDGNF